MTVTRASTVTFFSVLLSVLPACGKPDAPTTPPGDPGGAPATTSEEAVPADGPDEVSEEEPDASEAAPQGASDEPTDDQTVAAVSDPNTPASVPEDPAEGLTEPTNMASVKLEIKGEDGKVFKDKPKVIRWDQLTRIPIDFGSRLHEFDLLLGQDKKSVDVQISYTVGGKEVLRKYRFDTKVGTREVIQIEGGVAVALTVTPKTIKPRPAAERDKVEAGGSRDPLAGAKK